MSVAAPVAKTAYTPTYPAEGAAKSAAPRFFSQSTIGKADQAPFKANKEQKREPQHKAGSASASGAASAASKNPSPKPQTVSTAQAEPTPSAILELGRDINYRRILAANHPILFLNTVAETLPFKEQAEWLHHLPTDLLKNWALSQPEEFIAVVNSIPLDHAALKENPSLKLTLCRLASGSCHFGRTCKFANSFFEQVRYQINHNPRFRTELCRKWYNCRIGHCHRVHVGDLVRKVLAEETAQGTVYTFTGFLGIQTKQGPLPTAFKRRANPQTAAAPYQAPPQKPNTATITATLDLRPLNASAADHSFSPRDQSSSLASFPPPPAQPETPAFHMRTLPEDPASGAASPYGMQQRETPTLPASVTPATELEDETDIATLATRAYQGDPEFAAAASPQPSTSSAAAPNT